MSSGQRESRRGIRRRQRRRVIARARRMFAGPDRLDLEMQEWAAHNHDHLKKCSCWMCGHTRKWHGPPAREKREAIGIAEEMLLADVPPFSTPEDERPETS